MPTLLIRLTILASLFWTSASARAAEVMAPRFEVDLMWPKPLPNHWIIGSVAGVSVDAHDHIWIVHRPNSLEPAEIRATLNPPAAECCVPAPPVLEFNEAGDLVGHWGGPGPGYDWPTSMHGIHVDYRGNVWLGGNGREVLPDGTKGGARDKMVLKFTHDGKFLMQIGKLGPNKGSNDVESLAMPAKMIVDRTTDELFVADGYGNRRVIVFDASNGSYKRHWGAYGHKPDDTDLGPYRPGERAPQQFRTPVHCVALANDGLLYVCDRNNDRVQVFKKDGTFVKEAFFAPNTMGDGSVLDLAFSNDPQQRYLYGSDASNMKVYIIERSTLKVLTTFGAGGRQPGQFYAPHMIATDSKGNLFTGETYRGQRVQKFLFKGLAPVKTMDQGVLWPKAGKK
ncbi:MAG TPA: hypothetical protein VMU50_20545 [Polyangia bacterium]|nr:hypothetical protein [Polyangia bacterium]